MRAEQRSTAPEQVLALARDLAPGGGPDLELSSVLSDAGFDSLACADLALAVEERFGVRLSDSHMEEIRTLDDVVSAIRADDAGTALLPQGIGRSAGVGKAIAGPVLRWWFRMRIEGAELVPGAGPVIIAPNHRSMWDIPVLVVACPRRLVFMAKIELYRNAFLRRLWFELGGFSVRREIADLRAIDTSLEVLRLGQALGIYPEGTRSFSGEMLPFLHGAAWLALMTGAPIVPVGIVGSAKRSRAGRRRSSFRRPISVRFGPPIRLEAEANPSVRRRKLTAVTAELEGAITGLIGDPIRRDG